MKLEELPFRADFVDQHEIDTTIYDYGIFELVNLKRGSDKKTKLYVVQDSLYCNPDLSNLLGYLNYGQMLKNALKYFLPTFRMWQQGTFTERFDVETNSLQLTLVYKKLRFDFWLNSHTFDLLRMKRYEVSPNLELNSGTRSIYFEQFHAQYELMLGFDASQMTLKEVRIAHWGQVSDPKTRRKYFDRKTATLYNIQLIDETTLVRQPLRALSTQNVCSKNRIHSY